MRLDRDDAGVARLTMDEGRANAIGAPFVDELRRCLDELEAESPTALVLTGTGRHFCAGLDLNALHSLDVEAMDAFIERFEAQVRRFFLLPFPVVAEVNGSAVAGGCVLAAACDHRVAAVGSYKIGVNEIQVGASFPGVVLEVMRCLLAPAAFREAVLIGDLYEPDGALDLGLVDELIDADGLTSRTAEVVERLRRAPVAAFAQVKRESRAPYVAAAGDGRASRAGFRALWQSDEANARRAPFVR